MMPTQKVFKQRIRARMAKTGESYTSARSQLLRKASADHRPNDVEAVAAAPNAATAPPSSDPATIRATGRAQAEWYALIDAAGIATKGHTAIARWLVDEHGVDGWWSQSITVGYERVRGLRAKGQMADGFTVSVSRTLGTDPDVVLDAFVSPERRTPWLPDAPMRQRRTTAAHTARFDWDDPESRVVVWASPRDDGRTTLTVSHEKLADGATAERMKAFWRERLTVLARLLGATS